VPESNGISQWPGVRRQGYVSKDSCKGRLHLPGFQGIDPRIAVASQETDVEAVVPGGPDLLTERLAAVGEDLEHAAIQEDAQAQRFPGREPERGFLHQDFVIFFLQDRLGPSSHPGETLVEVLGPVQ